MSDIDPEKLMEDLKQATRAGFAVHPSLIFEAARAWLAQQPRFKEVEFESWATFTPDGNVWSSGLSEQSAKEEAANNPKIVAVRLTGTAKVKVMP